MKTRDCPQCFGTGKTMSDAAQPRVCKHCGGMKTADAHVSAEGRPIHHGDLIEHVSGHYGRGLAELGASAHTPPYPMVRSVSSGGARGGDPGEFRHAREALTQG